MKKSRLIYLLLLLPFFSNATVTAIQWYGYCKTGSEECLTYYVGSIEGIQWGTIALQGKRNNTNSNFYCHDELNKKSYGQQKNDFFNWLTSQSNVNELQNLPVTLLMTKYLEFAYPYPCK